MQRDTALLGSPARAIHAPSADATLTLTEDAASGWRAWRKQHVQEIAARPGYTGPQPGEVPSPSSTRGRLPITKDHVVPPLLLALAKSDPKAIAYPEAAAATLHRQWETETSPALAASDSGSNPHDKGNAAATAEKKRRRALLIVGIVVGVLIAEAIAVTLAVMFYKKKRQRSAGDNADLAGGAQTRRSRVRVVRQSPSKHRALEAWKERMSGPMAIAFLKERDEGPRKMLRTRRRTPKKSRRPARRGGKRKPTPAQKHDKTRPSSGHAAKSPMRHTERFAGRWARLES